MISQRSFVTIENRLYIRQAAIMRLQGCQNNDVGSGKIQTENKYLGASLKFLKYTNE